MKIGILTYHRATNYGAVLQAYGLINRLKKDFPSHHFEIIDYSTFNAWIDHRKEEINALLNYGPKHLYEIRKKNKIFKRFSDQLPTSKFHIISNKTKRIFKKMDEEYDLVIVGSDAVFSWNGKKFPTAYYLDCNSKYVKVSYAASAHRLFYKDSSNYQIDYCKKVLNSFSYIGVRDHETEKMINFFNKDLITAHNCDPSFLIEMQDIYEKCNPKYLLEKYNIPKNKEVLFLMTPNQKIGEEIKRKFPNFFVISLFVKNTYSDLSIPYLNPFEWASIFKIGTITVSEYFHATIFSLKNGTPAIAIDTLSRKKDYEGKIFDLLVSRLKLEKLYINIDMIEIQGYSIITSTIDELLQNETIKTQIYDSLAVEKSNYLDFYNCMKRCLKYE